MASGVRLFHNVPADWAWRTERGGVPPRLNVYLAENSAAPLVHVKPTGRTIGVSHQVTWGSDWAISSMWPKGK